jgi:hypothetical protein
LDWAYEKGHYIVNKGSFIRKLKKNYKLLKTWDASNLILGLALRNSDDKYAHDKYVQGA